MLNTHSPAEQFLIDFHKQHPGITSQCFQALATTLNGEAYPSSYACLSSQVADDATVLDLACGDGYLLSLLSNQHRSLHGLDMSMDELAAAQRRLGQRAQLHHGKAQSLPFENHSIDHVLCHMALMLMAPLDVVLSEVHRVLKKGGCFSAIIGAAPPSSPALAPYLVRLRKLLKSNPAKVLSFGDKRLGNPDGIHDVFSSHFELIQIEDLQQNRRYTPSEIWAWFEGCYDLAFLSADDCSHFYDEYLNELNTLCAADGKIEFTDHLRRISAIAR
ncbi:class I SAM-dependent methyltransferase [Iodobacter sp. CM08]|uniref:class I SAM-dependent methyltransferase n=1 Tax=Iodobacter sp. CM08 TaxID=3085902 RepID=UPI002980DE28|nr:class I SAM-dependent methyltransferase [Iodobacter sp. CM08]MDW5416377.1 class I SAM-dependent methyltransferase [Iodobacter sp. CM08]